MNINSPQASDESIKYAERGRCLEVCVNGKTEMEILELMCWYEYMVKLFSEIKNLEWYLKRMADGRILLCL